MIETIEAQADAPQFEVPRDLIVLPTTWIESGGDAAVRINDDFQSFTINQVGKLWLTPSGRISIMTDRHEKHVFLRRWTGEKPTIPTVYVDGYTFTSWGLMQVLGDHGYLPGAEMVFSETSDPDVLVGDIVDRGPVKR